jgi:integrase
MIERSPGVWRLQVTTDTDPLTGKRRRVSRSVRGPRADAVEALQRLVVESGAGLEGGQGATVEDLLDQFMATVTLSPSTRQDWDSLISRHLKPAVGAVRVAKLTARHCDHLYARLASDGLGPSRVRCVHVVLHRALAQAVRWGWLTKNPVSAAQRPEVPRTTVRPPTISDVRAVLASAAAKDFEFWCWLQIAIATGARRGEVCALTWGDVDFEQRTVRIDKSVTATTKDGIVVKSTKTGRVRRVSLTQQSTDALAELEHRSPATGQTDLVFTADPARQRPWRPEMVTRRWERLRAKVGLDHVRLHDLRHFVATELLTVGIDARTVANRLGHARTSTTLDIYWAWVPARDRDAADHLESVL